MANIELPRDAVGREISLDTKVLYTADGIEVRIDDFVYGLVIHVNESTHDIVSNAWRVHSGCNVFDADRLYLIEPDSLKKLLEDLDRAANAEGSGVVPMPIGANAIARRASPRATGHARSLSCVTSRFVSANW